jgi:hypothetical protein
VNPIEGVAAQYPVRMRGRMAAVLVVLVIVVGGGVVTWRALSPSKPGGDPGNAFYGRLHLATGAIPPTATDVRMESAQATQWTTGCPEFGSGSRSGWTRVYLSATFDDTSLTPSQVLDNVNAVLVQQGWTRHDEPTGPGRGMSPHWTLRPHGGRSADLFLFSPNRSTETDWFMGVSWQPPGPIGSDCP